MNKMKTFRIDSILAQCEIKFTDLANMIGVSRTNVYNYFNDDNTTISVMKKTAKALNVNVSDLFYNEEVIVKGYIEFENDEFVHIINNLVDLQRFNIMLEDYMKTKNNCEVK